MVSLQLFKYYCLPFILYATETVPLTKSSVKVLDDCVQRTVSKIFKVNDRDNIAVIRRIIVICHTVISSVLRALSTSFWVIIT